MEYLKLKKVFSLKKEELSSRNITLKGWVRTVRKSKSFSFIELADGTCQESIQIIADESIEDYATISKMLAGTCIEACGPMVEGQGKGSNQKIEMQASRISILGAADSSYPLQKKGASLEFLREISHLRSRTNLFGAIFRIRHQMAMTTHQFFSDRGLFYVNTPIVTAQDAEGAGEMFNVTTLNLKDIPKNDKGEVDYKKDYFQRPTYLAVTGQLEGECMAMGLGGIYTFGPTFRSENSNTPRHLSEFWMIEPEIAFADLEDVAELGESYIKKLIQDAFEKCPSEMAFLEKYHKWQKRAGDLRSDLENVLNEPFKTITYTEAIEILGKSQKAFEFPTNWGDELQTEHERYLCEEHFKRPVIVTDYPKEFKAFYMKQNDDGKTVRAMDVLVPGVGEIIGGSQREDRLELLEKRMTEMGLSHDDYQWYLDLRRFGSAPHSGFGLGFERAILYVTGMSNIRDVIPFYRTPRHCEF